MVSGRDGVDEVYFLCPRPDAVSLARPVSLHDRFCDKGPFVGEQGSGLTGAAALRMPA